MMITLYRKGPRGEPHYYTLHDRQGHLFSEYSFTVTWGANLAGGRAKLYSFDSRGEMDEKLRDLLSEKFKAGYRVLYSYFKPKELESLRPALAKYSVS